MPGARRRAPRARTPATTPGTSPRSRAPRRPAPGPPARPPRPPPRPAARAPSHPAARAPRAGRRRRCTPTPDDRRDVRRRLDHTQAARVARPARRHEQELPRVVARRAGAEVREVFGPRIHELQHVVPVGCRQGQPDRADPELELRHRVDGVVVDRHERVRRRRERPRVRERVVRGRGVRPHAGHRVPRDLLDVEHEREPVHLGLCGEGGSGIRHDTSLWCRALSRPP